MSQLSTIAIPNATLADLAKVEGKAELIAGRIVPLMATGRRPNRVAARIFRSLDDFAEARGTGEAYTDNMCYAVSELSSGRQSFSPDASYFSGAVPKNDMAFIQGAPTFAVEVRSENDYDAGADAAITAKRSDYFEAGTEVVWDVDPVANLIRSYSVRSPNNPTIFVPGQQAHAEPAIPGWAVDVQQLFRP
jgi:Uma2 family endonuclease